MASENTPASGRSAEEVRALSDEEFDQWVAQVKLEGRQEGLDQVIETLNFQADITAKGGPESQWRTGRVDGMEFAVTLVERMKRYA
jgi:hypothetical protein